MPALMAPCHVLSMLRGWGVGGVGCGACRKLHFFSSSSRFVNRWERFDEISERGTGVFGCDWSMAPSVRLDPLLGGVEARRSAHNQHR